MLPRLLRYLPLGDRVARPLLRLPVTTGVSNSNSLLSHSHSLSSVRFKHSSTQIKRLFRDNQARRRVESRMGIDRTPAPSDPIRYAAIFEPEFLSNGWSAPPGPDVQIPEYPFRVSRTKNKPTDAIGFLPIYTKHRYVFVFHSRIANVQRTISQIFIIYYTQITQQGRDQSDHAHQKDWRRSYRIFTRAASRAGVAHAPQEPTRRPHSRPCRRNCGSEWQSSTASARVAGWTGILIRERMR